LFNKNKTSLTVIEGAAFRKRKGAKTTSLRELLNKLKQYTRSTVAELGSHLNFE
jgi:hypothetical protein